MRTLTGLQQSALQLLDRATHIRVDIEDPDGNMQDVTDFNGLDFLDQVTVEADVEQPGWCVLDPALP